MGSSTSRISTKPSRRITSWASLIFHNVMIILLGTDVDGSPAPAPRRIMFDQTSTFADIKDELRKQKVNVRHWTLLQTHYGPVPYWSEADPKALLATDCHTVYAINSRKRSYILGVLRSSDDDSPLLFVDSGTPQTIAQTVSTTLGIENIKSITLYSDPLLDAKTIVWDYDKPLRSEQSTFPTAFVITLAESPGPFQLYMSLESILLSLRDPFMDASDLRVRAYRFQFFALQTVHLSKCLLHAIVSLTRALNGRNSVHSRRGPISPVEKWTPVNGSLLFRNLEQFVDDLERCESSIATACFDRDDIQANFDRIFLALCTDYPGAVVIRHPRATFEALKRSDQKKLNSGGLDEHVQMAISESGYTSDDSVQNEPGDGDTSDEESLEQQMPRHQSSQYFRDILG